MLSSTCTWRSECSLLVCSRFKRLKRMRKRAPVPSQMHVMDRVCAFSPIFTFLRIFIQNPVLSVSCLGNLNALHTDQVHNTTYYLIITRLYHNKYIWGTTTTKDYSQRREEDVVKCSILILTRSRPRTELLVSTLKFCGRNVSECATINAKDN